MFAELAVVCTLVAPPTARCRCGTIPPLTSAAAVRARVGPTGGALIGRAIRSRVTRDTFGIIMQVDSLGRLVSGPADMTDFVEYTVVVTTWWGVQPRDTVAVRTPVQSTMCGTALQLGTPYLFLTAGHDRARGMITRCFPPPEAESAKELIAILDGMMRRGERSQ